MNGLQAVAAAQMGLETALTDVRSFLEQGYLDNLNRSMVCSVPPANTAQIRMICLDRVVFNEKDIHERLVSLYRTMGELSDACFLILDGGKEGTSLYLGMRAEQTTMAYDAMKSMVKGCFPGTTYTELESDQIRRQMAKLSVSHKGKPHAVASVSQVPSRRGEGSQGGMSVQGLEHFIDAMQGKEYTAMILAVPLKAEDARLRRMSLENLYTSLSSLEKITCQYGDSISASRQEGLTKGITRSLSLSVAEGFSTSCTRSEGRNKSHGTSSGILGVGFNSQSGAFSSDAWQNGESTMTTRTGGTAEQVLRAISDSITRAFSRSKSFTQTNKTVVNLLSRVDQSLQRIEECETYGAWDACAFFAAENPATVCIAANAFKALACGQKSGLERSVTNVWPNDTDENRKKAADVCACLAGARMPQFQLSKDRFCTPAKMISGEEMPVLMGLPQRSVSGVAVTSMEPFGREVVLRSGKKTFGIGIGRIYHMGDVEESIVRLDYDALCAHTLIAGMPGEGKSTLLAMLLHATQLLAEGFRTARIAHPPIRFMLIEPVKGEYKRIIGKMPGLKTFTANPKSGHRLLRINPFELPHGVTFGAHLERLMAILSVCWPLYAAQGDMLKTAIEEMYIRAGWDTRNTVYVKTGKPVYPTFRDLLMVIPDVAKDSRFVGETKGAYEGGLITRVKSLTQGVYDETFNCGVSLSDEELFENNVIIDLSDCGSEETVSMIMGLLIMRLREYRTAQGLPTTNQVQLKHLMVLEEAHNILPRCTRSNAEGGETISGKSADMIANMIAEMRGYGQGFIIADQTPSRLNTASLSNTATKIVMRLQEAGDQQAIADALSLSPAQTREIARLPGQTAVVYQKDWVEPVLTRISDKASIKEIELLKQAEVTDDQIRKLRGLCAAALLNMEAGKAFDLAALERAVSISPVNPFKKEDYLALFRGWKDRAALVKMDKPAARKTFFGRLCEELLSCELLLRLKPLPQALRTDIPASQDVDFANAAEAWKREAAATLDFYQDGLSGAQKEAIIQLLLLCNAGKPGASQTHNALYGRICG